MSAEADAALLPVAPRRVRSARSGVAVSVAFVKAATDAAADAGAAEAHAVCW